MTSAKSGYKDVMVGCRPQRVIISFEIADDWMGRAAVVIAAMGRCWGGSGFILIPHRDGSVHPALLRLSRLYDPDYVNEFNFTDDDFKPLELEVVDDGGQSGRKLDVEFRIPPIGPYVCMPPPGLMDATSVYRAELSDDRSLHGSGWMRSDDLNDTVTLHGGSNGRWPGGVFLAVPPQVGGTVGLAMAMRCGFVSRPRSPFETDPSFNLDERDVGYALGLPQATMAMLSSTGGVAIGGRIPIETDTAWKPTLPGLATISFHHPMLRPSIIVVGSSPDDFAVAFALHRMTRRLNRRSRDF